MSKITTIALVLTLNLLALQAQEATPQPSAGLYQLSDFGTVSTAEEADATLASAIEQIIAAGGGQLVLDPKVTDDWEILRNPAPSSVVANTPTVTLVDRRTAQERVILPSNATGYQPTYMFERTVHQPIDRVYGKHSSVGITTNILGGTMSYLQSIPEPIKKGDDRRIYVPTIRGLAVDHVIQLYNPGESVTIKALGWDKESQRPFFVADVKKDHEAPPSIYRFGLGNKHVVNGLTITDNSQSDNQSMTVKAERNVYGDGDSFVFHANLRTQGNIMGALGDEGALCYGGDISNDLRAFNSTVESIDWAKGELVYAPGRTNNFALGTSRPVINRHPDKQVNLGHVYIVAPGHADPWDPNNEETTGKGFKEEIFRGGAILGEGTAWTQEVVGRFFAVDVPTEYIDPANDGWSGYTRLPKRRVYRWYHIRKLEDRPDGLQRLYVERTRWVSSINNVPKLYLSENYSTTLGSENHMVPLAYIIAPGAYVTDVSQAWTDSEHQVGRVGETSPRTLKLAPSSDFGTAFDFEPGDPIEQAIGQDPYSPSGIRIRHHNYLPSTIEDSSFISRSLGRVPVYAALSISGGGTDIEKAKAHSKSNEPSFRYGVHVGSSTEEAIAFKADVEKAAIRFYQPNGRPQPMIWHTNEPNRFKTLTVDPESGNFQFRGSAVDAPSFKTSGGISATDTPANNLRGFDVPVRKGDTSIFIRFPLKTEADAAYSVTIQPNWMTMNRTVKKTPEGFEVEFSTPAPADAMLDWQLIR